MPKMISRMARTALIAGTASSVSNRVARRQHGGWAQQAQADNNEPAALAQPSATAPAPSAQPADMSSKLTLLQQLGELRAQGILTEAEFATQKDKILAG